VCQRKGNIAAGTTFACSRTEPPETGAAKRGTCQELWTRTTSACQHVVGASSRRILDSDEPADFASTQRLASDLRLC
jgi:hypothetical protein